MVFALGTSAFAQDEPMEPLPERIGEPKALSASDAVLRWQATPVAMLDACRAMDAAGDAARRAMVQAWQRRNVKTLARIDRSVDAVVAQIDRPAGTTAAARLAEIRSADQKMVRDAIADLDEEKRKLYCSGFDSFLTLWPDSQAPAVAVQLQVIDDWFFARSKSPPIFATIHDGDAAVLRAAVAQGEDLEVRDEDDLTPLMRASRLGRAALIPVLLDGKASIDGSGPSSFTALLFAVAQQHDDVARLLIAAGANVNAESHDGTAALALAAQAGSEDLVERLVSAGSYVTGEGRSGLTALTRAAGKGHLDVVKYLLGHGAQAGAISYTGASALGAASGGGHRDVVRVLLDAKAPVDGARNGVATPLGLAAGGGHADIVRDLLAAGANPDAADRLRATPLLHAASGGYVDVVRLLLDAGASVDAATFAGTTPLMAAATSGKSAVAQLLIEAGADVDRRSVRGDETALMFAAAQGHADVITILAAHHARVDAFSVSRFTALMWAAQGGKTSAVKALLSAGADPKLVDRDGRSAADIAEAAQHEDIARLLRTPVPRTPPRPNSSRTSGT